MGMLPAIAHDLGVSIGAVVAAGVVTPERRAGAVAAMFSGLTIATVGGVPLAAWIGETVGWRAAFWGIAAVGALAMIALRFSLPPLHVAAREDMRMELRVLRRGPVVAALVLTVLSASAMFTVFTYIVPILRTEAGASAGFVTAMLVVYGLGLTAGNWLGGRLADSSLDGTLIGSLAALVLVLALFAGGMRWEIASVPLIFLWGIASFAIVPPLQMKVVTEAAQAPNLASAMNIGAFNLGNAVGAALGGGVIDAGLGYPAVSLTGAGMAVSALAVSLILQRGRRQRCAAAAGV